MLVIPTHVKAASPYHSIYLFSLAWKIAKSSRHILSTKGNDQLMGVYRGPWSPLGTPKRLDSIVNRRLCIPVAYKRFAIHRDDAQFCLWNNLKLSSCRRAIVIPIIRWILF
jgi:hypothetical protein